MRQSVALMWRLVQFTNPGAISHNEVLDMYREEVDPTHTYTNFSVEEQSKILACGRSNNELDASKLMEAIKDTGLPVLPIHDAVRATMKRMKAQIP